MASLHNHGVTILHLWIGDIHLWIGDIHLWIGDIHLWIGDIHLWIGDIHLGIGALVQFPDSAHTALSRNRSEPKAVIATTPLNQETCRS